MPNDAKLGLLAGLTAVLVVAVVYFQKPPTAGATPAKVNPASALTVSVAPVSIAPAPRPASLPSPKTSSTAPVPPG